MSRDMSRGRIEEHSRSIALNKHRSGRSRNLEFFGAALGWPEAATVPRFLTSVRMEGCLLARCGNRIVSVTFIAS
jgi:hypothetical protein